MKIVCQQGDLAAGLAIAARGVSQRSTVQILSGILLRAEASLELAATDMELSLRVPVAAQVEEPGAVVLPGRLLLDIVKALPAQEVTIEQPMGTGAVRVACGQSEYTLHAQGAEDFPHLPEPDGAPFSVEREAFSATVSHVSRAASRDESRPVLTGVLVEFSQGAVTMAATDSYRLSVKQSPLPGSNLESQAIVPARALGELTRIATGDHDRDLDRGEPDSFPGRRSAVVGSPDRWAVPQLAPAPAADVRARDRGQPSRVPGRGQARLADGPAEPAVAAVV